MKSNTSEKVVLAGVMFVIGYAIGVTRTYSTFKTDASIWVKLEAASKIRQKMAAGAYKALTEADRKIAIHEDYNFWVMANIAEVKETFKIPDFELAGPDVDEKRENT